MDILIGGLPHSMFIMFSYVFVLGEIISAKYIQLLLFYYFKHFKGEKKYLTITFANNHIYIELIFCKNKG